MSHEAPRLLGAVLAGGRSRRFGSPKWRAAAAGQALGARAILALEPNVARVVVVSSDAATRELGREVWDDVEPGRGPVVGVLTALRGAHRLGLDGAFVLACDLPLVTSSLVAAMVARARDEDALVPLGRSGPEPLCALYRVSALPAVERALAAGGLSARALAEGLRTVWLPFQDAVAAAGHDEPFLNVNTPAELERARGLLVAGVS